ncbi:MAG: transcription elongation factor subunit Spt4 [Candidatus Methanofastidiosia archaeon]
MKYACKECKRILPQKECYVCKNDNVSDDWGGIFVVIDPKNSEIAKEMGYKTPGRYALRVR